MSGGTFTVSNIGSMGGTVVAPVIVEGQVAILGVGRCRGVAAFVDGDGEISGDGGIGGKGMRVVRREVGVFSYSADHRVVDGAMVARFSERVRRILERPGELVLRAV